MNTHAARNAIGPIALSCLLLTGCASSSITSNTSPSGPSSTVSSSVPSASATPTSAEPVSASPSPSADVSITASVADGKVTPATTQYPVPVGSRVHFVVSSDVADEVHLHGYDIEKQVKAGGTVVFDFVADQTGTFEVETHGTNLVLFRLVVS